MRMTWTMRMALPFTCAALLTACGNADEPGADARRAQEAGAGSRQVSVEGCVEAAAGTSNYVLRQVHVADTASQPSDVQTAPGTAITEGSWVKLSLEGDDRLREQIGKKVAITGVILDSGTDTIGTSGQAYGPDESGPRTDASRASGSEHHAKKTAQEAGPIAQQSLANGTAPTIAVQSVTSTGEGCANR